MAAFAVAAAVVVRPSLRAAAEADPLADLKKLSVEELMSVEVISVSKQPERWFDTPSSIQVITGEEIRRSGATSLPEALRLAPNLQVAQVNASQWAVSARGFNNVLANKLLVMIDGRTVYTPLYAGVFWDVQDTLLEDVSRIEVVSGPGGALWGANAVNGVINVRTKSARDTQGALVEAGAGSEARAFGGVRYGGQLGANTYYRIYARAFDNDETVDAHGTPAGDGWHLAETGLRVDATPRDDDLFTFDTGFYEGRTHPDGAVQVNGEHALGRWTRTFSPTSDLQLQLYFDRALRDFGQGLTETLETWDADAQHRFALGGWQQIVWGAGVRLMQDREENLPGFGFNPAHRTLNLYSAFAQDEVTIIADCLQASLGLKYEHNDYTGGEYQPGLHLTWTPTPHQTGWAAVTRAVRTPSRVDRDLYVGLSPSLILLQGGEDFTSEDLLAYELGWRLQPTEHTSFALAGFYNQYDHLRSAEPGPPPTGYPITIGNGVEGHTYGLELSGSIDVTSSWRLRGGYTWLRKELQISPGSHDLNRATAESDDPEHQVVLQSMLDLPHGFALDTVVRYVAALPDPHVPAYTTLDLRLAWQARDGLELSLVGQNLLEPEHPEFAPTSPGLRQIERGYYGKVTWRY